MGDAINLAGTALGSLRAASPMKLSALRWVKLSFTPAGLNVGRVMWRAPFLWTLRVFCAALCSLCLTQKACIGLFSIWKLLTQGFGVTSASFFLTDFVFA